MKPGHDPKTPDEALTLVAEEASELAAECLKLIQTAMKVRRFGWNGSHPDTPDVTNGLQLLSELDDVTKRGDQLRALLNDRLSDPPELLTREILLRGQMEYTVKHRGLVVAAAASGTDLAVILNGFRMLTGLPPNLEPLTTAFSVMPGDKFWITGWPGWARLSVKG